MLSEYSRHRRRNEEQQVMSMETIFTIRGLNTGKMLDGRLLWRELYPREELNGGMMQFLLRIWSSDALFCSTCGVDLI